MNDLEWNEWPPDMVGWVYVARKNAVTVDVGRSVIIDGEIYFRSPLTGHFSFHEMKGSRWARISLPSAPPPVDLVPDLDWIYTNKGKLQCVRHVETGSIFVVLDVVVMQNKYDPVVVPNALENHAKLVLYQRDDDLLVCPVDEFCDGRFVIQP